MVGVAAVGLAGGGFLVVDLGLDDLEQSNCGGYGFSIHQREKSFDLAYVQPHEEFIVPKRRTAVSQKLMICLEFNCMFCTVNFLLLL